MLEVLGVGGMGVVFRAEDPRLQRPVALKAMKPLIAQDQSSKERFLREAQATAAIEHDHIVSIYQVGEDRGVPFIAMRLLRGESLKTRLEREGRLDQRDVLRIGREIASGLAVAHARGLIHRDIKPDNVWLEADGDRVKIVDFGLVRAMTGNAELTQSGVVLGTPKYMAPEQAEGLPVDHRCDLFSLGSVLYHLAAGQAPFEAPSLTAMLIAVVRHDPAPLHSLRPDLLPDLVQLITQLLSKQREDRPQSAPEVVKRLRGIEREFDNAVTHTFLQLAPNGAAGSSNRRVKLITIAALFLLPVICFLVALLLIKIETPAGTIILEYDPPELHGATITLDGQQTLTIQPAQGGEPVTIQADAGKYLLKVTKGGFETFTKEFTLKDNEQRSIRVRLEPKTIPQVANSSDPPKPAPPVPAVKPTEQPVDREWIDRVAALPAVKQAEEVVQELKRRNPDFRGHLAYDVQEEKVANWTIADGTLPDLSPLLALRDLKNLEYAALDPERDAPILRAMASLVTINDYPAATFRLAYPANKPKPGVDDAWVKSARALKAETQIKIVMQKLKDHHPNFDGTCTFKSENDRVISLKFFSDVVTDLSPLKALPHLQGLACNAFSHNGKSWLSDLSPLEGMKLRSLNCYYTRVSDLSPLSGMPLVELFCEGTPVFDLSPLKGMKLTRLHCAGTRVSGLSPLEGMPLTKLDCNGTRVSDLSPLRGMPLTALICSNTSISDLSPLAGMPLTELNFALTPVKDLSPLTGMPLTWLSFNHYPPIILDFTPLKDLPLTYLRCNRFSPAQLAVVREIKTLETINEKPAAAFWQEIDAKQNAAAKE